MSAQLVAGPATPFVAAFLLAMVGCGSARERKEEFPVFPAVAPVNVSSLSGTPEQKLCVLDTDDAAKRLVKDMSERLPHGWTSPSRFVSFAPSYRIALGTTEILLLKGGVIISSTAAHGERTVSAHELASGEAESIVRTICGKAT